MKMMQRLKFLNNIIIALFIVFICFGCKKEKEPINEVEEIKEEEVIEYKDDNPIEVGIYKNDLYLVKEFETYKESRKDLIFAIYYTNEENLGVVNTKGNWNKYYNNYTNIDDYKIGFHFSFETSKGKIEKTILKPETFAFEPYFYIYIYDDINQPDNTFYSHLEEKDINENTVFSSIKIFLWEPQDIISPIEFTVFTYNGLEDFDEFNNYRGSSKYKININLLEK